MYAVSCAGDLEKVVLKTDGAIVKQVQHPSRAYRCRCFLNRVVAKE